MRVDVRVVSSTTSELSAIVQNGGFRKDLLYRLAAFTVRLPPLRERKAGILFRAHQILDSVGGDIDIDPDAAEALSSYAWPGNDQELDLVIARSALLSQGTEVKRAHLPVEISGGDAPAPERFPLLSLDEYEHRALKAALEETEGNVTQAAKLLGIGRATFYRKAHRYGVELS